MSRHDSLKAVAKEYLKMRYGFKDEEISEEYRDGEVGDSFVIDVAGIRKGQRVAVEVGQVSMYKVLALQERFDDVVWIPYWLDVATGTEDLAAEVQRRVNEELRKSRNERGSQTAEYLERERAAHVEDRALLERVLWKVFTMGSKEEKAAVAKLIDGHGFEAHHFSKPMLRPSRPGVMAKLEEGP